ncbi:MAG TPA: hypothetical protein ENI08_02300 [Candidatus Dependentiae bacterium]|nr:hypothetical protein [Candidatus Dependentiae bacterium]
MDKELKKIKALESTIERKIKLLNESTDKAQIKRMNARLKKLHLLEHKFFAPKHVHLIEKTFKPTRALTTQEERVQFSELNEQFNKIESQLEDDLIEITAPEIDRFVKSSEKKIDNKDLAAIAIMAVLIKQKTKEAINKAIKKSYNIGKSGASQELDVPRSPTPLLQTQIQNAEVDGLASIYVDEMERSAKSIMVDALAVGAATAAIVSKVRERMTNTASKMIMNISGTTVGQYINRGRRQVFTENINKITKFQRSEILDNRTCFMCLTLDERIVKADDPLSQMDLVHTNCRGIWVPIFVTEEQPKINPIPKTAIKNFDFVDGRPLVNAFKQLKRPINRANVGVQNELKKRLT